MSASFIAVTGQQGLIHIADIGRYAQWRSIAACLIISINRPICTQIKLQSQICWRLRLRMIVCTL